MNNIALYVSGGALVVALFFGAGYGASNLFGKVTYEKSSSQTASVVKITNNLISDVDGIDPVNEEVGENIKIPKNKEKEMEDVVEEELVLAIEEEPAQEQSAQEETAAQPFLPVQESSSAVSQQTETIAALQEQVETLVSQVSNQTQESDTELSAESSYFITPSGIKIDGNGNVVNENGEAEEEEVVDEVAEEVVQTSQSSGQLPIGYYRLPTGVIIGPGGVVVDEDDLDIADEAQTQAQTTSLDYYITPSGQKIDRYGNIVD